MPRVMLWQEGGLARCLHVLLYDTLVEAFHAVIPPGLSEMGGVTQDPRLSPRIDASRRLEMGRGVCCLAPMEGGRGRHFGLEDRSQGHLAHALGWGGVRS